MQLSLNKTICKTEAYIDNDTPKPAALFNPFSQILKTL